MEWFVYALLSAFFIATADALTKRWLQDYTAVELTVVRFGSAGVFLAPVLLLQPWPDLPFAFFQWVAALLPLELLAMALYMRAIRDYPLAKTVPYLAFTPVITTLTGYLLLGETVSAPGLAGILLVVAGAYFLNLEHRRNVVRYAWLAPLRGMVSGKGARLMLGVAVLYSLTSVMGKGALQYTTPEFFASFYFTFLGVAVLLLFARRDRNTVRLLGRRPGKHAIIGLVMAAMVWFHFLAIDAVEVAYMITVKRTSLLFAILYGALLFGEPGLRRHLGAGILMLVGVLLIGVQEA